MDLSHRVEGADDLQPQLCLPRGGRDRTLVVLGLRGATLALDLARGDFGGALILASRLPACWGSCHRLAGRENHRAIEAPVVGCIEIDDVAQQHLSFVEGVTPTENGVERQRAFADGAEHHLAASLDALRNRHLSFTRQELDRPHLPQIHPNRVVCTPGIVMTEVTACLGRLAFGCHRLFALVALGHRDPEFG